MGGGPAIAANSDGYSHLITDARPWWKNSRIMALNCWIVLLLITSSTNGYDGSMMNGLQSVDQWQIAFGYPTDGKLGLLNAIQNIGALAAYPFAPYLTDGLGRRPAIFIGATIMVVGTAIQTASISVGMFIGARFLVGFGLTFAANAAPLLITEIAFPTQRAQATSMYNSMWYLGSIIAAWATFGTFRIPSNWAWRIPSALQGLPSLLQIMLIWIVPESPRWLVSKGRDAEALKVLAYYHANGDHRHPLVNYEFDEIKTAIDFDRDVASDVGWLSLFKGSGNLRRMRIIIALAFFSQWSGNGLVSYYLNKVFIAIGITDPDTQLLINGFLNIFNFIIAIVAGFLCDKVGRRPLFLISCGGMLLFWTLQTICFALYAQGGDLNAGHTVIAMIFLYYGFYDVAFTPLVVSYTIEILPFALRAKGFTIFNFVISLSLIFNQYVNPIALGRLGWKYYLVYVVWIAFEMVFCYFFILETKNLTLEETAALFDGDDTVAMISATTVEPSTPDGKSQEVGQHAS
ncbi:general substrate transporter [Panaeolus papilionaceus]|nr:general substrate transporter [Panaeolus papilionaceus]